MNQGLDIKRVRREFPDLESGWASFDAEHGARILQPVLVRHVEFTVGYRYRPGSDHDLSTEAAIRIDRALHEVMALVNAAGPADVLFGASARVLLADVCRAIAAEDPKAEALVLADPDCGGIEPIAMLCAPLRTREWRVTEAAGGDLAGALSRAMTGTTRLVLVPASLAISGQVLPIAELAATTHGQDARIAVVASRYARHRAVDVAAWQVDFCLLDLPHVYGPAAGLLCSGTDALRALPLYGEPEAERRASHFRCAPGFQDFAAVFAAGAITNYLESLDIMTSDVPQASVRGRVLRALALIAERERGLHTSLLDRLNAAAGISVVQGTGDTLPGAAFQVEGWTADDLCQNAGQERVAIGRCAFGQPVQEGEEDAIARISLCHFHTEEDLERLIDALPA